MPFLFCKCHKNHFSQVKNLALAIPASSADLERMFTFSDHILTNNITSPSLFINLVDHKFKREHFII